MQTDDFSRRFRAAADQNVHICNDDPQTIARLLGAAGEHALTDIVRVICQLARREAWPLREIRIQTGSDPDVPGWDSVMVIVSFDSTFERADQYMQQFYPELDAQIDHWTADEQEVYWKVLSLDFEATAATGLTA